MHSVMAKQEARSHLSRDEATCIVGLRRQQAAAAEEYLRLARKVSGRRFDAARALEKQAEAEMADLAMTAHFKIEVGGSDHEEDWTASGLDRVTYLISTNAGAPLAPVEEIASGGELSRVMLALKVVVARGSTPRGERRRAPATTMVFDEIDTGIGGRAAEAVGRKLKSLGQSFQVLCITHLPQVASFADEHYLIEKREAGGKARTQVQRLEMAERRQEVARMLSGATVTEVALKNAAQMLKANG